MKDANNPWWVKNTLEVKYCIQVDEGSISVPKSKVTSVVKESIDYWKTEFSRTTSFFSDPYHLLSSKNQIGVATQRITETACTGDEDLRFQFGYGTLTDDQKNFLKDPLHYIGIAVRTSYDEENLRGKGFIFIGSDKGPHRFAPETQIEEVWRYDAPLHLAVLHELGHVFGIPHVGGRYSLMGADLLEVLTSKAILPALGQGGLDYHDSDYFFFPKNKWLGCPVYDEQKQTRSAFFGLQDKVDCLEFTLDDQTRKIGVSSYRSGEKARTALGLIDSLNLEMTSWPTNGVILILNRKQTIFGDLINPMVMLLGPSFVSGAGGARLVSNTGEMKLIHMQVGPDQFEISGDLDGKHQSIVSWRR